MKLLINILLVKLAPKVDKECQEVPCCDSSDFRPILDQMLATLASSVWKCHNSANNGHNFFFSFWFILIMSKKLGTRKNICCCKGAANKMALRTSVRARSVKDLQKPKFSWNSQVLIARKLMEYIRYLAFRWSWHNLNIWCLLQSLSPYYI